IRGEKRKGLYENGKIIVATPQCIKNDLEREILRLRKFSLVIFDEAHKAVKDYPYTFIAKLYKKQSLTPRILGLTASPGGTYERIAEVKRNLFIEAVEIRSEYDEDVRPYVKEISKKWVYVPMPEKIKEVDEILKQVLKEVLEWLKEYRIVKKSKVSKKELIQLQEKLAEEKAKGIVFTVMRKISEAIKIYHTIELLETQGVEPAYEFLKKLLKSKKRSDRLLFKYPGMILVLKKLENLKKEEIEHPKLKKLLSIVKELVVRNSKIKIIVFANYRKTVEGIVEKLKENGISVKMLIGQARKGGKGLSQKDQIKILKEFAEAKFNVLVATSIGEEGLDIVDTNVAIFYEPVPSEIRMIQRRGRVGRQSKGYVIFLITKGSMDEAFYWASYHRAKKMRKILRRMREENKEKEKKTLMDWLK
ncbi:MAG: DEAD/DEAH box helicase family protein, partial [Candidatus Aenigmarchaeota archaeon]|nr:DEAD/DEAH box helicase family protein [Candidatus Aenigmarchaeota archaeon]